MLLHALNNLFMVVQVCCMINMYLIHIYDIYSFVFYIYFFMGGGGGGGGGGVGTIVTFVFSLVFHTLVNQKFQV